MAASKKMKHSEKRARKAGQGTPKVNSLTPVEAQTVFGRLLDKHPELCSEAEGLAHSIISGFSFKDVADEIESDLLSYDTDDLNVRAGKQRWGYVEPSQAAYDILSEAVEPYLGDMKRHQRLKLNDSALELLKGIMLGLYRVRDTKSGDACLAYSPDFADNHFSYVVSEWFTGWKGGRTHRGGKGKPPFLPPDFIERYVPEWTRVLEAMCMREVEGKTEAVW